MYFVYFLLPRGRGAVKVTWCLTDGHLLIALSVDDDGVVHAAPEPRWPSVDEERAAMRYMNTPDGMQLEPLASLAARRVLFGAGVR